MRQASSESSLKLRAFQEDRPPHQHVGAAGGGNTEGVGEPLAPCERAVVARIGSRRELESVDDVGGRALGEPSEIGGIELDVGVGEQHPLR
jgi:hypothetical protein